MIMVSDQPLLLDFIKVCIRMPQDERDQLEAFTGVPYDIDGAAIGNFTTTGPKWVLRVDNEPICVGGFVLQRPGVYRDFMLNTPEAFEQHWFGVTRIARRAMNAMFLSKTAHRLECIAPAQRLSARPQLENWYRILGYKKESVLQAYCANRYDAVMFARIS